MAVSEPLTPQLMTRRTARTVRALDASAQWVVDRFVWLVNAALTASVRVVLAFDGLRDEADRSLSGDRFIDGRWYFVCCWCGSKTIEGGLLPLTCCRLEARARWIKQTQRRAA